MKGSRVEDIQDIVEEVLIKNNLYEIAKRIFFIANIKKCEMESLLMWAIIGEYIGKLDWRVKKQQYYLFVVGLLLYIAGSVISDYV